MLGRFLGSALLRRLNAGKLLGVFLPAICYLYVVYYGFRGCRH